jgi:hypothetical protein
VKIAFPYVTGRRKRKVVCRGFVSNFNQLLHWTEGTEEAVRFLLLHKSYSDF